jgi:hypothetical protein
MKNKFYIFIMMAVPLLIAGCKDNPVDTPESIDYSGQYQNVKYSSDTIEPSVTLTITQSGTDLTGTGKFNALTFSFSGKLDDNHAVITFDLLNTNVGDLRNCVIDGYFGSDNILAGGYTLSQWMGTEKIRFKQIEKN